MPHLYELIQRDVAAWREAGYPADDYSAGFERLEMYTPLLKAQIPDRRAMGMWS